MKQGEQLGPFLEVFQTGSNSFLIRVLENGWQQMATAVVKTLPVPCSCVIALPKRTVCFNVGEGEKEVVPEVTGRSENVQQEEDQAQLPLEDGSEPVPEQAGEENGGSGEILTPPARTRKRKKYVSAIADVPCLRCEGSGEIQVIWDSGQPMKTQCPICGGEGKTKRI